MAIQGIIQPGIIPIGENLRLRKFDGVYDFALVWYQDPELVWLVDGNREPYDRDRLSRMYRYLNDTGELYFIETRIDGRFTPIGDVTFRQEDMPIVIGDPAFRGRGIGRRVISALVRRGRALGYPHLSVREIYDWNEASRRCFESVGFRENSKTEKGAGFLLKLER